jgi:hypothetical protein
MKSTASQAAQPIRGGAAPGNAPIKTAQGVFCFIGVYTKEYKIKLDNPSIPVRGLSLNHKIKDPEIPQTKVMDHAVVKDILPVGRGRFLVLDINLSKFFSNI